jgi:NAD(P)-dependent dehydrogenase (short-subunit alcohol dehydrogenase family)
MQIELTAKIALVTGASRGIGRAVALELARAGADVALTARSEADLGRLASEIRALGRRALPIVCDVLEFSSLESAVSRVTSELGPVDILVNNAGITQGVKFSDQTYELWQRVQRVNVDAAMRLTQLTIDGMAQRKWGRVINIASIAAKAGLRYSAAYNASKHAMLGLTRSVALDYATKGVTVNAVCPGWVATEMVEETVKNIMQKTGRSRDEAVASLVKDIPQQQMVQPEEVAALVLFLASNHARAITGQGLNIDGGTVMD